MSGSKEAKQLMSIHDMYLLALSVALAKFQIVTNPENAEFQLLENYVNEILCK